MCPVCSEAMLVLELDGVDIDRCDRCGGTWLDSGELSLLLERRGSPADDLRDSLMRVEEGAGTGQKCPRCRGRLREVELRPNGSHITIGRCHRGHGIWCDRGEMSALISEFGGQSVIAGFLGDICPRGQTG